MRDGTPWRAGSGVLIAAWVLGCYGCTGSATIRVVSLNGREIDPPTAGVSETRADECVWWRDENGDLRLGMRREGRAWFFGRLIKTESIWVFHLGEPPAGRALNYPLRGGRVQGLERSALANEYYSAGSGIVSVIVDKRTHELRGSFRIWMSRHPDSSFFTIFPQQVQPVLVFGTYHANEDAERGRSMMAPFGGTARPTSQTATSQAATSRGTTSQGTMKQARTRQAATSRPASMPAIEEDRSGLQGGR